MILESDYSQQKKLLEPNRLEAFSDGVLAIIITITALSFQVPKGTQLTDLFQIIPVFITYALSFQIIGTYWINHHHLLGSTKQVNPRIMWSNLYLLFWLSLIPFATSWLGQNYKQPVPTLIYTFIMCMSAIAYTILQQSIIAHKANGTAMKELSLKNDFKGKLSLGMYILALAFALFIPIISDILLVVTAMIWFFPDRRLEKIAD